MKKELNKWYFGIDWGKCRPWQKGFYPYFDFWFLKFIHFPPQGEMPMRGRDYKGILIRRDFRPSIMFVSRTFKFRNYYYQFCYPAFRYYWKKLLNKTVDSWFKGREKLK